MDEAVTAVRRVVERHPELSLTLTVRGPDGTVVVDVEQRDGQLHVDVARGDEPTVETGPTSGRPGHHDEGTSHPAVRLAEILREDPYLLYGRRPED